MGSTHIRFDWAIKRLLRQKANFGILEGFLSELLEKDVAIQELLESEGNKDDEDDKFNRVDILAKLNGSELVIIEVQNDREHDYFHRMNYGQAKLISQYMVEGEKYKEVKRIISVNIVYFELGQGVDYVYYGQTEFRGIHTGDVLALSDSQKGLFPQLTSVSDIFARYYIIKVNHFNNVANNSLDEWIYFLKNSEIPEGFNARGLAEAKEKMRADSMTPAERIRYEHFVKEQRIRQGEIDSVRVDDWLEIQNLKKQHAEAMLREQFALQEKDIEQRRRQEAEKQAKEAERQAKEAEDTIVEMIKQLSGINMPLSQIAILTKKTEQEIKNILGN